MIDFVNVTKVFLPEKKALDEVSFSIDPGEFVFVTGHSGCGKTTLLRLFLRELQPTSGEIIFNGQNLHDLSRRKVADHRRQVGVVFQDYKLLDDLTVWENIALPLTIAHQSRAEIETRINELLKMLKLGGRENDFPAQLSGGEAQRVSLARALSVAPKVIFADEPTGNLDADNGETIYELLKAINKYGTTVIFATHNLGFVKQNQQARHLEFDEGKLVHDSKLGEKMEAVFKAEPMTEERTEKQVVKEEKATVVKEEIEKEEVREEGKTGPVAKTDGLEKRRNEEVTAEKIETITEELAEEPEELEEPTGDMKGEKSGAEKTETKKSWGFFAHAKTATAKRETPKIDLNNLTTKQERVETVDADKQEREMKRQAQTAARQAEKERRQAEKEEAKRQAKLLKEMRAQQKGFKRQSKVKLDKVEMKTEAES